MLLLLFPNLKLAFVLAIILYILGLKAPVFEKTRGEFEFLPKDPRT